MKITKAIFLAIFGISIVHCEPFQNTKISAPLPTICNTNDQCSTGQICIQNQCKDRCMLMRCSSGTICKMGQCNKMCDRQIKCQQGFYCGNDGFCIDKCIATSCPINHSCQNGKCIKNTKTCSNDKNCKSGQSCVNKQCIKLARVAPLLCPSQIKCKSSRPNNIDCPLRDFIRSPDPLVCGVTSTGSLVNFPVECYACKQKSIVYYFNTPCQNVPKSCMTKIQAINDAKCKNGYKFVGKTCVKIRKQKIKNSQQLKQTENKSKCSTVKCKNGFKCQNGKCVVDKCYGKMCIATTTCIDGVCVPIGENSRVKF